MDYKEYCKININRRYCDVKGIKISGLDLKSHPLKTIKQHWIAVLAVFAIIIGFMLMRFDYRLFLLVLGFAVLFFVLFLIGNKYELSCNNEGISVKQHFQTMHIPPQMIKNVYIVNTVRGAIKTYVLTIRCEDKLSLLREVELPLLCADKEEAFKFVDNFLIAEEIDENKMALDKKREFKRIVGLVFKITCAIIIAWYLIAQGIIPMPH